MRPNNGKQIHQVKENRNSALMQSLNTKSQQLRITKSVTERTSDIIPDLSKAECSERLTKINYNDKGQQILPETESESTKHCKSPISTLKLNKKMVLFNPYDRMSYQRKTTSPLPQRASTTFQTWAATARAESPKKLTETREKSSRLRKRLTPSLTSAYDIVKHYSTQTSTNPKHKFSLLRTTGKTRCLTPDSINYSTNQASERAYRLYIEN